MNFRLGITTAVCLAALGAPGAQAQNRVPAQPQPLVLGELPASPDALPQAATAKPAKPHVYTNDNLPASRDDFNGADFSTINDCNHQCFEQVRLLAHVSPSSNPNWKRDLLQALDPVRKDPEWQTYLRQVYDAHLRFCQLGEEKREELARVADPENVTARELNVDDKFDGKFRDAQASLQTLYLQQRPLQQKFAINNFSLQFSQLQVSRIQTAPCAQPRYMATGPNDPDDP
jgi:negative regulator of sigma E activity